MGHKRQIQFQGYRADDGETYTHYPTEDGGVAEIPQHNAGIAKKAIGTKRLTPVYAR